MSKQRPPQNTKYKNGYYQVVNENKYVADSSDVVYRSSLEYKFCIYVDLSENVLKWGSEIVKIPYIGPDNKKHLYHIDYYVEIKNPNHPTGVERLLVEVKPHDEAERILKNNPPEQPKKMTPNAIKNWEYALNEFMRNKHKWTYAQEWARQHGMKFIIVTEKILNEMFV